MEDVERLKDKSGELLKASAVKHDHHKGGELVQISCKASDLIKNVIGETSPGSFIEFCTAGEFSLHQLIQHLLTETGPADIYLSTWTLKEEPARVLYALKKAGLIKTLNCVFDYRIRTLDAKHFDFVQKILDSYTLTKVHAKVVSIIGENRSLAVSCSANMSNNPRIEAGVISCNSVSAEFHKTWITDVINGKKIK
ncbi:MAG: hypothetical protein L6Q66_05950 [Bacteroidia bacterium]|nr:hypothetical protein [Bacteroidia bacterium]